MHWNIHERSTRSPEMKMRVYSMDGSDTDSWLIYALIQSHQQLGLVSAVRGLPLIVFGTIAGAVADRYGCKK